MRWIALIAIAVTLVTATPVAGADGSAGLTPSPVPVGPGQAQAIVTVNWNGMASGVPLVIMQCRLPVTAPDFDPFRHCPATTEVVLNQSANPGYGSTPYTVFRGVEPSGDETWGCFAAADAVPAGFERLTTCYLRVTTNVPANTDDDVSIPLTFTTSGTPAPSPTNPSAGAAGGANPAAGASAGAGATASAGSESNAGTASPGAADSEVAAPAGTGDQRLSYTGGNSNQLLLVGGALLVSGGVALALGRLRRGHRIGDSAA